MHPSVAVIDATPAVLAAHLQAGVAGTQADHAARRGSSYNDRLAHAVGGSQFMQGTTPLAGYELGGGGRLVARVVDGGGAAGAGALRREK